MHFRCAGEDLKRSHQVENLDAGPATNTIRRVLGSNDGLLFLGTRFDFNWRSRILPIEA